MRVRIGSLYQALFKGTGYEASQGEATYSSGKSCSTRSSKMAKNVVKCICCCAGFNLLIYTACAILQWIVFASERADEVACLNGVVLAAAILSSLATLLKAISGLYSAYLGVKNIKTGGAIKFGIVLKVLQFLLKLAANSCTLYFTISASKPDPCGTEADLGNHKELSLLITAVVFLETISSFIESVMKLFELCYKCHQRKKMRQQTEAGQYQPLNNAGEKTTI